MVNLKSPFGKCTGYIAKAKSEAGIFIMIVGWVDHSGVLSWSPHASFDTARPVDLLQDTSKPVRMMTQRRSFSFAFLEDLQAKILGIPYRNSDLSMFVLLPDDIDGLEKVQARISRSSCRFRRLLVGRWCPAVPSRKYFSLCAGCPKRNHKWHRVYGEQPILKYLRTS